MVIQGHIFKYHKHCTLTVYVMIWCIIITFQSLQGYDLNSVSTYTSVLSIRLWKHTRVYIIRECVHTHDDLSVVHKIYCMTFKKGCQNSNNGYKQWNHQFPIFHSWNLYWFSWTSKDVWFSRVIRFWFSQEIESGSVINILLFIFILYPIKLPSEDSQFSTFNKQASTDINMPPHMMPKTVAK